MEFQNPMTTTVKIHVNGRYRAVVRQSLTDRSAFGSPTVIEGNYDGSPNPSGEGSFYLPHPALALFEIREFSIDARAAADDPKPPGDPSLPGSGSSGTWPPPGASS